jgi:hypothetical protein
MLRATAFALLLVFAGSSVAWAEGVTPPPVPQLPDEPLPEWHPPPPTNRHALFLQMAPQMQEAQKIRQAGLWISSVGWAQLLLGGVLYAWAADLNQDEGSPPPPNVPGLFNPQLEDERNRVLIATRTFLSIGGIMAAGGFVLYTIGQWKITSHHKSHPSEPLPPLSGF